jgi:hypothetical protein
MYRLEVKTKKQNKAFIIELQKKEDLVPKKFMQDLLFFIL